MKRSSIILLIGFGLGLLACLGAYAWRTAPHRSMLNSPRPELAWLQSEFDLSDAEYARIEKLHMAYLPQCAEMCGRIDGVQARVQRQLSAASSITPELEALLADAADLRVQCQKEMLEHFFAVSREMSPEQGERYLAWVRNRIFVMSHAPVEHGAHSSGHGR